MASVRMTNELRADIRRKAEKAYEAANPIPKPDNEFVNAVRDAILNGPQQKYLKWMHDRGTELGIHNHLGTSIIPRESSSSVTGIELRKMRPDGDNHHRDYDELAIKFSSPLSPYCM